MAHGSINIGGDNEIASGIKGWDPNDSDTIMMFDPIRGGSRNSSIEIRKTRNGNLFLGGYSAIDGSVKIEKGSLILTNVEYTKGSGYSTPEISLRNNSFYLE